MLEPSGHEDSEYVFLKFWHFCENRNVEHQSISRKVCVLK